MNEDLIAAALRKPIDWARFEDLVVDLLRTDDMPSIRRLGKTKDRGLDAVEESYFDCQVGKTTVVQVTSQKAQLTKLKQTLTKLAENAISFDKLVCVFRDPVAQSTMAEMRAYARECGCELEVRDEGYLIGQLSRPETTIFKKYFGEARDYLDALAKGQDPLHLSDDSLSAGILASAITFGRHGQNSLRLKILDRLILAEAVAASAGTISTQELTRIIHEREVTGARHVRLVTFGCRLVVFLGRRG